jgi:hypothetical protein
MEIGTDDDGSIEIDVVATVVDCGVLAVEVDGRSDLSTENDERRFDNEPCTNLKSCNFETKRHTSELRMTQRPNSIKTL